MSSIPICSICCENFTTISVVKTTKCGHLFHGDCIQRWMNSKSTCPECRQVTPLLHRVYLNFNDAEEGNFEPSKTTTIATPQEVENLIIRLSIEEAKRQAVEARIQEIVRQRHEQADFIKEKEREQQAMLKTLRNKLVKMQELLDEEQKRRRAADEAENTLRKELNVLKQTSVKKVSKTINSGRTSQIENGKNSDVTINLRSNSCVHHTNACGSRLLSSYPTQSSRSRNGLQSLEYTGSTTNKLVLRCHFLN